jgi:hypothetical protein
MQAKGHSDMRRLAKGSMLGGIVSFTEMIHAIAGGLAQPGAQVELIRI